MSVGMSVSTYFLIGHGGGDFFPDNIPCSTLRDILQMLFLILSKFKQIN